MLRYLQNTRRACCAAIVLVLPLAAACNPAGTHAAHRADSPPAAGGRIESAAPVFNFGPVANTLPVKHAFEVRNAGDSPLRIEQLQTTCGCTVASLPPESKVLQPGASTGIDVTLDLRGKAGPQRKEIRVHSTDPVQPVMTLVLEGSALELIRITPPAASFGIIKDDSVHERQLLIEAGMDNVVFNIEKADCPVPGFDVTFETLQPGKQHRLAIRSAASLPPDTYMGEIILKTDYEPQPEIRIKLTAKVLGHVIVAPPLLTIQRSAGPQDRFSRKFRVWPGRDTPFSITRVDVPAADMVATVDKQDGDRFAVTIDNIPTRRELDGKEIVIHTDCSAQPAVRIPIRVLN